MVRSRATRIFADNSLEAIVPLLMPMLPQVNPDGYITASTRQVYGPAFRELVSNAGSVTVSGTSFRLQFAGVFQSPVFTEFVQLAACTGPIKNANATAIKANPMLFLVLMFNLRASNHYFV
jgi:hypothetical protein